MLFVLKTTLIICLLSAISLALLGRLVDAKLRNASTAASKLTVSSFICLCAPGPWGIFAGLGIILSFFTYKRTVAVGSLFLIIIALPAISVRIMAGSLQLINFSTVTCAIIGMTVGSLFWDKKVSSRSFIPDFPAYLIICVLTFISARDTSATNVMRVIFENFVSYALPYIMTRKALSDAVSIKMAVLFVVAAGVCVAAVAIFESLIVWPMYQVYAQRLGMLLNAGVKMRGGMLRASGPAMNPPLSSCVLALCFVTCFASRSIFRSKFNHNIALLIIAVGLFMMQSRVGWLGAVVGSMGVTVSRHGSKALLKYIPFPLLIFASIYGLASVNPKFADLVGFSADAKGSSAYRSSMTDLSIDIIKDHPVIGQPTSIVEYQMRSMRQGEGIVDFVNGYMSIALFSGLAGLGIFTIAVIMQGIQSYSKARIIRRRGAGSLADLGVGVVTAFMTMIPFVPIDYHIMLVTLILFATINSLAVAYSSGKRGGDDRAPKDVLRKKNGPMEILKIDYNRN